MQSLNLAVTCQLAGQAAGSAAESDRFLRHVAVCEHAFPPFASVPVIRRTGGRSNLSGHCHPDRFTSCVIMQSPFFVAFTRARGGRGFPKQATVKTEPTPLATAGLHGGRQLPHASALRVSMPHSLRRLGLPRHPRRRASYTFAFPLRLAPGTNFPPGCGRGSAGRSPVSGAGDPWGWRSLFPAPLPS